MLDSNSRWRTLASLLRDLPKDVLIRPNLAEIPEVPVGGLKLDSRKIIPGDLFIALRGENTDGHRYIPQAIKAGAAGVIGEEHAIEVGVPYVQVSSSRKALALLAASFYGHPARNLRVVGVTGTDGKTTTVNLIHQILHTAGVSAGMISTVNAVVGSQTIDTGFHVTTPEATDVQRLLAMMVDEGLTHVVLEATSHGLVQHRVTGCDFDVGVITNITHEHLDYHQTYVAYRAAKAGMFDLLAQDNPETKRGLRIAIINQDDSSFEFLSEYLRSPKITEAGGVSVISYGLKSSADVFAEDIHYGMDGISFMAIGPGFRIPIRCRLTGEYNVYNCLAAISTTVMGLNINPQSVADGIYALQAVPGRMEILRLGTDFMTVVDFAHTPNALRQALTTVRSIINSEGKGGKIIAIFGSAGLRDRAKRQMMAEVSAELADFTILTAEDPRTESLDDILAEMAAGCRRRGGVEGQTFWRIKDRGEAIRFGISMARPGDVVIALGKGHEQSMCFGEVEYPWDDRTAMRSAVAEYLGIAGPPMPYLPTQG